MAAHPEPLALRGYKHIFRKPCSTSQIGTIYKSFFSRAEEALSSYLANESKAQPSEQLFSLKIN